MLHLPINPGNARIRLIRMNVRLSWAEVTYPPRFIAQARKKQVGKHPALQHLVLHFIGFGSNAHRHSMPLAYLVFQNAQSFVQRRNHEINDTIAHRHLLRYRIFRGCKRCTTRNVAGDHHGTTVRVQFAHI